MWDSETTQPSHPVSSLCKHHKSLPSITQIKRHNLNPIQVGYSTPRILQAWIKSVYVRHKPLCSEIFSVIYAKHTSTDCSVISTQLDSWETSTLSQGMIRLVTEWFVWKAR
ncbi:hypothetical protein Mapa_011899 [Marchantia paleacea]|nr:hypothetical protein Mapa_011899 [Marchantia paleacea]